MIPEFRKLTDPEAELMFRAPVLVCILIAGADGRIDNKEIRQAIAFVSSKKTNPVLEQFFALLAEDFEDKIKITIQSFPYESTQRTPLLLEELSHVNHLLKKVPTDFGLAFYDMLRSLAEKVAASSGGIFGINSITAEESKYIRLPMIEKPAP